MKTISELIEQKNIKQISTLFKENKKTILPFVFAAIAMDVFFLKESSDFLIFSILAIYIILIKLFKITSRLTFSLCIALLIAMFVNYVFTGTSISTEKTAVWLILFLVIGVIQQWRE